MDAFGDFAVVCHGRGTPLHNMIDFETELQRLLQPLTCLLYWKERNLVADDISRPEEILLHHEHLDVLLLLM